MSWQRRTFDATDFKSLLASSLAILSQVSCMFKRGSNNVGGPVTWCSIPLDCGML